MYEFISFSQTKFRANKWRKGEKDGEDHMIEVISKNGSLGLGVVNGSSSDNDLKCS